MSRSFVSLGVILLLVGCAPPATLTPDPSPTPEIVQVQVSPAVGFLRQALHDCALADPTTGLVLEEVPAYSLNPKGEQLAFRFGTLTDLSGFTGEVGIAEMQVIVHPSNPIDKITSNDLEAIYSGQKQAWDKVGVETSQLSGKVIHAWSFMDGDEQQQVFTAWLGLTPGRGIFQAPSPRAMLEAVAEDPQAIGYILKNWGYESVKPVHIEGDTGGLSQPLLVMADSEPQGAARRLVACIQTRE